MNLRAARPAVLGLSLGLIVLGGFASGRASADTLEHTLLFHSEDLVFSSWEGRDKVHLEGEELTLTPGEPELPVHLFQLLLPGRAVFESVTLAEAEWVSLPGTYRIAPVEQPFILSSDLLGIERPGPVTPSASVYESDAWYPSQPVEFTGDGFMAGVHLGGFRFFPVRYSPSRGTLEFCRRAVLRVDYSLTGHGEFHTVDALDAHAVRRVALGLAENAPSAGSVELRTLIASHPSKDGAEYDYLIVTANEFAAAFQALADWKTQKGLRTLIRTVEEINVEYAGIEPVQARVRQCIIDAVANWGVQWVLLGGDTDWVPYRETYAMNAGQGIANNRIAADLYFADLDGDWNANGVEPYGEVADDVDLYSDVFVGRWPARSTDHVEHMTAKLLTYEKNPPLDYQTDMLMTGEVLWGNPYTDSGIGLDWIDETCVPDRFDPIQKLYQSHGNESVSTVMNALDQGKNFWIHDGHGNINLLSVGTGVIYTTDLVDMANRPRFSITHSIACLPARFQAQTSWAEKYVRMEDGGVAFIGNNCYGWGCPGNPKFGYSDRMQHRFFETLFQRGYYSLGQILAEVKAHYVPYSQAENVYRWHQYEITLLGDPEFSVWTRTPQVLTVEHPASHPMAPGTFAVTVSGGGMPIGGALVCVMGCGVYERGRTDGTGQVFLGIAPDSPGDLLVTVTAPDALPYEGTAAVLPAGPYAAVRSVVVDDGARGNGNGLLNRGESVDLVVTLENPGTETAQAVTGTLTSSDPLVTVTGGSDVFGDLLPGGTAEGASGFVVEIDVAAGAGHVCLFDLELESTSGGPWPAVLSLPVAAPWVDVASLSVDDRGSGDGDLRVEPGEGFDLLASLRNRGTDLAADATARVRCAHPCVILEDSMAAVGDIPKADGRVAPFSGEIAAGCPDPSFPSLVFEVSTSDGYVMRDTTILVVGTTGSADDFESGASAWTHGGTRDHWHLTSTRTHSGASGWYCGLPDTATYEAEQDAWLGGPPVALAPDPVLSFWMWHEVPTYGVDGLYVVLHEGAAYDTLDFIATGGALLNIGNDWLEYSYSLSDWGYGAGDEVELLLGFVSDGAGQAEGFYIDDVVVTGILPGDMTRVAEGASAAPGTTRIVGNRPNPFNPETEVLFDLASEGPVDLALYDVQGRRVSTLMRAPLGPGRYSVRWDGTSEDGGEAAAGVYFVRLRTGATVTSSKIVLLE